MKPEDHLKLAELIHRELRSLPNRPAPSTLLPRVLVRLQAQPSLPCWRRPWTTWPPPLRWLSLAMMLAAATAISVLGAHAWQALEVRPWFSFADRFFSASAPLREGLETLASASIILIGIIRGHVLFWGTVIGSLMYLSCVGLGTVFLRVALPSKLRNF